MLRLENGSLNGGIESQPDNRIVRLERIVELSRYMEYLAKKLRNTLPCYVVYNDYLNDYENTRMEISYQQAYAQASA